MRLQPVFLVIFGVVLTRALVLGRMWNITRPGIKIIHEHPKISGDKISFRALSTRKSMIRKKIVTSHNLYRSMVKPHAANMLKMSWSKAAAFSAQKWANSCHFLQHGGQETKGFGTCGQNIFVSSNPTPWAFVVRSWYNEVEDFVYGNLSQNGVVGHYTQLVWATSHKVGCAVQKCTRPMNNNGHKVTFYNYICNYCPAGNIRGLLHLPYQKGKSCSECKNSCYRRKLCTNECRFTNKYSNCDQLNKYNPFGHCNGCEATCKCKRKIYQRYDELVNV